jgi:hypothetical protein
MVDPSRSKTAESPDVVNDRDFFVKLTAPKHFLSASLGLAMFLPERRGFRQN